MSKKKRTAAIMLSIAALSLSLAACGKTADQSSPSPSPAPTASPSASAAASPFTAASPTPAKERTLTDGLGHQVKIPAQPKTIIASYLEDYLVALGVKPAAQWSVANGIQDYLQGSLKGIPTIAYDLPFEAVSSFNPDLLIIGPNSTVEGGKYDQYNKIAPTFVLGDEVNGDWRKALAKIGEVLGKNDEAKKALDDYNKKAADAKAKIQAAAPGKSIAAIWLVSKQFFVVSDKLSSGNVLYQDLGFKVPAAVTELAATGKASWNPISLEKLAQLDADFIVLINSDGSGAQSLQDAVWKSIPAVKNGKMFEYPASSSWLYYGPVASSQMVDNVVANVAK
ncbi:ABC transporter substrate-binding protein [Paenibacillus cymbidii]|uniref:ABC transporter substrate-binding protein n=1 Tax=Paenibacillus cymbidii TaxID=1639034 RepID=UPI002E2621C3